VPQPFDLDDFAGTVGEHRSRPIQILPLPGLGGTDLLSGAWLPKPGLDLIVIDADASAWHRQIIGLHELMHILCDHKPDALRLTDALPDLGDAAFRHMLGRHGYSSEEEREAEMMGTLVLEIAEADPMPVHAQGMPGITGRLACVLRHPVRHDG
jgi:hypothetical protein